MTSIYLGRAAYSRGDTVMPEVLCINQFAEQAPNEEGAILLPRPGLKSWSVVGSGPARGMYQASGVLGGNLVCVSGTSAYSVADSGTAVRLGDVPGAERVEIAASGKYVVFADSVAGGYYYDGTTFAAIAFPDGAGVSTVDYIDGYFVLGRRGSQRFYWTAVNAVSVDALDYASAERAPDNLVCVRVFSDMVWLFGDKSIETWVPNNDPDLPFERVNGRVIERGCLARDTVVHLDATLFWVGDDGVVYRANGAVPLPVSTNTIAERIRKADPANLRAWSFSWDGHIFYALTIDDQGTFAYDASTGQWCVLASYQRASWRAHLGVSTGYRVLAGDDETGQIWQLDGTVLRDGTAPISIEATGILPIDAQRLRNTNFSLDIAVGTAAVSADDTNVSMRYSDDAGRTWSNWKMNTLGAMGRYSTRVIWRRLGRLSPPGRVFHVRMTSPVPYRLAKAAVNEKFS